MDDIYYSGQTLLSKLDVNGNKPEIYLCSGNRTAGKTTFFNRYCFNRFLNYKEKFVLLYRFQYELTDVAEKYFSEISRIFFKEYSLRSFPRGDGTFCELVAYHGPNDPHGESCGYAITLNGAEQVRKKSHQLADATRLWFDEFQSETNKYCDRELTKFKSIHTSLARGQGEQVKYFPFIMASNNVSLINPYFVDLGIADRIRSDTKFLRGTGFVLEITYNESAAAAQRASGFNQAFQDTRYLDFASQNIYLNDSATFIDHPSGRNRYLVTVRYEGRDYAIREYAESGIIYCDDRADLSYPLRISITTADHQINYVMLKKHDMMISNLRYYFDHGCFRFKNLQCKNTILKMISYY